MKRKQKEVNGIFFWLKTNNHDIELRWCRWGYKSTSSTKAKYLRKEICYQMNNVSATLHFSIRVLMVLRAFQTEKKFAWKIIGLIWILIECSLVAGKYVRSIEEHFYLKNRCFSIFRYVSFSAIFPVNGTYVLKSEPVGSHNCSGLGLQYQVRREIHIDRERDCMWILACLCIGNWVLYFTGSGIWYTQWFTWTSIFEIDCHVKIFLDYSNLNSLRDSISHLIGWISLAIAEPGSDWLILLHKLSTSIAGVCTLLSSISISAHFVQHRGLVMYEFNLHDTKYEWIVISF